ncbi:MAG: M14 family zinc carboxypeptidase [Cloacibacillus sp.]
MKKHIGILVALIAALAIYPAIASNYPVIEWGGYNGGSSDAAAGYKKYPKVVEDYFNVNRVKYDIPTFTHEGYSSTAMGEIGRVTSQEDMEAYLESLPKTHMQMRYVSEFATYDNKNSPPGLGEPLRTFKSPLLVFSSTAVFDPKDVKALGKPIVWIEASIHGGEIAGSEAMLVLAKRLADGDLTPLLDKVTVIIWPRYNLDGLWKYQRGTDTVKPRRYKANGTEFDWANDSGGLDQNRDNTGFESPITRLMHRMVNAYEPHFIADAHQMGDKVTTGTFYKFDITTLFTNNPNTPEELNVLAHDGDKSLENLVKTALRKKGLEWWFYIGSGTTAKGKAEYWDGTKFTSSDKYPVAYTDIQEGNPEEGITDTAGRLKGAFGLLSESRTPSGGVTTNYERRIQANEIVYETMIKAFADDELGPKLKKAVDDARKTMATDRSKLVVKLMNGDPVSVDVEIPGEKGVPILRLVRDPSSPDQPIVSADYFPARVSRSRYVTYDKNTPYSYVERPYAYIVSADAAVAARIANTGVRIQRLAKDTTVEVEAYKVTAFGKNVNFIGRDGFEITVSQLETGITGVELAKKTVTFPKGTFVFYMDQWASVHAALTVEPMGCRNFGNYWYNRIGESKKGFLPVALNADYPAYRYMKPEKLDTYEVPNVTPLVSGTFVEFPTMLTQEEVQKYTGKTVGSLITMSTFTVNNQKKSFGAYLPKTDIDGKWYAWNWKEEKAEELSLNNENFVELPKDNISAEKGVVLFKKAAVVDNGGSSGCAMAGYGILILLGVIPVMVRSKRRHW